MTRFDIAHLVAERDLSELAEDLRVSKRTVVRWMANGCNARQAEHFAVRVMQSHPVSVFGEAWYDAAGYKVAAPPARRLVA